MISKRVTVQWHALMKHEASDQEHVERTRFNGAFVNWCDVHDKSTNAAQFQRNTHIHTTQTAL